ncbi:PREDICTED: UPF0481 protein At3g47200-like [Fragaria vesca subsp. vesca]|uniref:UPF0481 protein At3g47200-like n=1 Tax=Fragaria vesca subsp. vesca TaxID=101020 RepID=UPI0002C3441B|nr:PREDICTED: UPF0481 protein At3g47200-like [Fragaria vesca subsp. vesca]
MDQIEDFKKMEDISRSEGQSQTRDHISLEITSESGGLVSQIKEKMENIAVSVSIFRVPNEKKCAPDYVSIGPLHYKQLRDSKVSEDDKWRYCYALLNRKPNLEASLDTCVKALKQMENKARRCYNEDISLTSDEFVQLMLIDTCFIIELFLKYSYKSLRSRRDPIFNSPGMLIELRCNMVVLENQIPFFVVQRLFQLVPLPTQCTESLSELATRFFKYLLPGEYRREQEGHHLLDLIRHCILPTHHKLQSTGKKTPDYLDCVKKLKRAGVKFQCATVVHSFLDVKFTNGVFKMPPLLVHHCTETLLKNLIALEQRHIGDDPVQHITSYAYLMGCLIQSEKDVKLLRKKQILVHEEKNDKEVFEVLKKLCEQIDLKDFYYVRLFDEVGEFMKRKSWHTKKQKLKSTYHPKTPSAVAVLVVAVLALLLTFVGAFFSILTFARHHI